MTIYQGFTYPPRGYCPICERDMRPGESKSYAQSVWPGSICPNCNETRLLTPKQKNIYLNAVRREIRSLPL